MASRNATLLFLPKDPRRRNLAVLAIAAAVSIALAVLALWHQAALVAPKYAPESFFPNLSTQIRNVARIHIVSKANGALDIAFEPSKGWVLPSMHNYPANFDEVRTTLIGMAALQTVAPQTHRADWLHYLGLDAPSKGGAGIAITLLDEKGSTIAAMIAGKTKNIGEQGGAIGLFVRKPDSTQSWLARSVFEPKADPDGWLDKDVVSIDRARIAEADVQPESGPSYIVRRDRPGDSDFALVNMPKGRALAYDSASDGVAAAIVGFIFDKVAPASQFDFANATRLVTKTFDGLTVTVEVIKQGEDSWATVSADAAPGKKDAQAEARKITEKASGWAYRIPAYKAAQFMTTLDSLLKPLETKAKKPAQKT